ncbi:MAG: hypothetical protein FWH18_04870 [Marinilabiliaceae bacterium]|nr:hypothetical protein [Marinilabiliaceae bacterium]
MRKPLKKPLWFTFLKTLSLVVVTFFAVNSCGNSETPLINENNGNDRIEISDTTFILKINETFILPNNTLIVSFVDVLDGRCPMYICHLCYGSNADILLSVTNSESENVEIELRIYGCLLYPDSYTGGLAVDTLGYRFQAFELSPYPDFDPINKNNYITKIKITKL